MEMECVCEIGTKFMKMFVQIWGNRGLISANYSGKDLTQLYKNQQGQFPTPRFNQQKNDYLKDGSKYCIGFGLISRGKKKNNNNKCYVPPDFPCSNIYASDKPCRRRPFRLKEKLKINNL
jgi:hypothetical protein